MSVNNTCSSRPSDPRTLGTPHLEISPTASGQQISRAGSGFEIGNQQISSHPRVTVSSEKTDRPFAIPHGLIIYTTHLDEAYIENRHAVSQGRSSWPICRLSDSAVIYSKLCRILLRLLAWRIASKARMGFSSPTVRLHVQVGY